MAEFGPDSRDIEIRLSPCVFLAILTAAQLLAALLFSPLFESNEYWFELICMGVVYTQPFLFAAWLVLGSGRFASRIQWSVYAMALILLVPNDFDGPPPLSPTDLFIRISQFTAAAISLSLVRRWAGWRIARGDDLTKFETFPVGFSIKSILLWTTAWAVYLAIVGTVWRNSRPTTVDWEEGIIALTLFTLMLAPLAFLGLAFLTTKWVGRLTIAAVATWLLSSISAVIYIAYLDEDDYIIVTALVMLGGMLAVCLAVIPLRLAGYRLLSRDVKIAA